MRTICWTALAAFAPLASLCATYSVDVDRPGGVYRCADTAPFTVRILSTNSLASAANPRARLDNFGSSELTNMPFDVTATGVAFTVSGTLREPGFLRLSLPHTKDGRVDPFVFSVGFEPEKIRKGSPSPADFDEFWAEARARLAREVPLDAQMTRVPERSTDKFDFYRISFATFGRRVHGYMSVPTDRSKAPFPVDFEVSAAGFGSWTNDMQGDADSIRVKFSVYPFEPDWKWREKGLESSYKAMDAELKARYGANRYCQAGITESREAYFFYPVILGIDRAVDWVAARPDVDRARFRYQGTSQGGGFGFYLCGLNRAFTRAAFYVPAITDTMGYLAGRQSGWPQIVESNSGTPERRAAAERWAPYFDGANFASRIRCPVRVAVGFSDTTCPPCAVYAAYNEIKVTDKAIGNGIGMTHSCFGRFYESFGKWVKGFALGDEDKAYGELGERIVERIRLWPGLAPHETESSPGRYAYDDKNKVWRRRDVSQPELVLFRPFGKPRDTMVVVMPGGGYSSQHMGHFCRDSRPILESGRWVAVLHYRIPRREGRNIYDAPREDAARAIRILRANAARLGVSPEKIGAVGFSAGAHLAAISATSSQDALYDRVDAIDDLSAHLNFSIPVYPAYVADDGATGPNVHGGDGAAILPEFKFDAKTPPMFMLHGDRDYYSPMASVLLYTELHKRKIPAQLFVYANVSHGLGDTPNAKGWQNRIVDWMESVGF